MSVRLKLFDKEVLHINNAYFRIFFSQVITMIEDKQIILSPDFQNFIEELDVAAYGIGFDVADRLKSKEDLLLLAMLVREVSKSTDLPEEVVHRFDNFANQLIK